MIHLFKKVYLTTDRFIDIHADRIVVSKTAGFVVSSDIISHGTLVANGISLFDIIGPGKKYSSMLDMLVQINDMVNQTNGKFYIFADEDALSTILHSWYKLILPNAENTSISQLVNSAVFRINVFYLNTFSSSQGTNVLTTPLTIPEPDASFYVTGDLPPDVKSNASVEFLLASYLTNGSMKESLKQSLSVLIKKDLEKYLLELKEIFFVHLMTPKFVALLDLPVTPSLDNLEEVLTWNSKFVEVFTSQRLWNTPYMTMPSASHANIKINALTPEDVAVLKEFTTKAGSVWSEELSYMFVKSDISKLDFLGTQNPETFTDELLNQIIDVEASYDHAAGSFFSIDLASVNHYLITAILNARNSGNLEYIVPFSL